MPVTRRTRFSDRPAAFTGGVLEERTRRNLDNLVRRIDVDHFEACFRDLHDSWYAEPEFAGHAIVASLAAWRLTGDADVLARAAAIVSSMVRHQRADGYLGTYRAGLEFDPTFSVWNQQFAIMGLIDYAAATGDEAALGAAIRCADFVLTGYRDGGHRIFDAVNQGIENTCILIEIVRLYEVTGLPRFLEFARWIVDQWEEGGIRFVSGTRLGMHSVVTIGCLKGIESLICYRGLLRLAVVEDSTELLDAVKAHWQTLRETQIGPTGNGTIAEYWTFLDPGATHLSNDLHPNENCVGVGWMQLSAELYEVTRDPRYLDAFEQTLYNHLLGSQANDGSDFSYYQGNVGRKVHATAPAQFSCCRYRGMHLLAQLGEFATAVGPEGLDVLLYGVWNQRLTVDGVQVEVGCVSAFPSAGAVEIRIDPERPVEFAVSLRVPPGTRVHGLEVDDEPFPVGPEAGFVAVRRLWPAGSRLRIEFEPLVDRRHGSIDGVPHVLTTYGVVVLAVDSADGVAPAAVALNREAPAPTVAAAQPGRIVVLEAHGAVDGVPAIVRLVDYATAGALSPGVDRFQTWLPVLPAGESLALSRL